MSRDEFNNKSWSNGDQFNYQGHDHDIVSLSFSEGLLGLDMDDDIDSLTWVRCESGEVA